MVQVSCQFKRGDYLRGFKLHYRGNFANWLVTFILSVSCLFIVASAIFGESTFQEILGIVLPVLTILLVLIFFKKVVVPFQLTRQLKQMRDALAPMELRFDDEGWHFKNEFGSYRVPWSTFLKYKEDASTLLLYRSSRLFQVVPKRFLGGAADLEYITGQLKASGIPNRTRSRMYAVQVGLSVLVGILALGLLLEVSVDRYRQRRDPVPAAEWRLVEKPGMLAFRVPGYPVDDFVPEDTLDWLTLDEIEPVAVSWSTRREGREFTVSALEYPPEKSPTAEDLYLVLYEIEERVGESNVVGFDEIRSNGLEGIRVTTRRPPSMTEAFVHGRRIYILSTDWPVKSDVRTFFDSAQIQGQALP